MTAIVVGVLARRVMGSVVVAANGVLSRPSLYVIPLPIAVIVNLYVVEGSSPGIASPEV